MQSWKRVRGHKMISAIVTHRKMKEFRMIDTRILWCITRSYTKELLLPFENLKRVLRSRRKLFDNLSRVESKSPEFDQLSEVEAHIEEEVIEIMAETMEQYMSKTREDYGGSEHEDANEHIEKVLEIVDLFHIPKVTQDQIMLRALPVSLTGSNPGSFTLPCLINNICFDKALVDLRASVSVMPFYTYTKLSIGDLSHTRMPIELADRTIKQPKGIAANVLVRIGKFVFPIDFIILDIPEDDDVPLILG
nr:hypothetical protein [Tanacetum cinerariifolium]